MVTERIEVDYEAIQQIVGRLERVYDQHQSMRRDLKNLLASLEEGGWSGRGANTFFDEMNGEVLPSLVRLEGVFENVARSLLDVAGVMREAEEKASNLFRSQGNPAFLGDLVNRIFGGGDKKGADDAPDSSSQSFLSQYTNGGEGWRFTTNEGFEAHEYVTQKGGSCTIYGVMNLLIQNGVDISQADADAILDKITKQYGRAEAFPIDAAKSILDEYGVKYDHNNFNRKFFGIDPFGLLGNDTEAAEKFLVEQVSAGNSVYVTTEVDESFAMGEGAHAYTVVGVQQDSNGKVTNVLVSTNWGNYQELPMDTFMKDWMDYKDGEYIVIKD